MDPLAETKTRYTRTRSNPADNQKESGRKGMLLAFLMYVFLIFLLLMLLWLLSH